MAESTAAFGPADLDWLCRLMALPTVSPFEGGAPADLLPAVDEFVNGALARGFERYYVGSPPPRFLDGAGVPADVRAVADQAFLDAQPSAVVSFGSPCPTQRRLVVNFHLDAVGPHIPPRLDDGVLHGRGAVDDKGPGVAAAAGIAAAFRDRPELDGQIQVLLAAVPGEEGGAMGCYGTRWLVDRDVVGQLMIFAEPTGCRVLDASTATMTPVIRVVGLDSTDDHPNDGHNATLALGFLADYLAASLGPAAARRGAKVCIAGLSTGESHNRVYGSGRLLLNMAYQSPQQASQLLADFERAWASAPAAFRARHAGNPIAARVAADWDEVVHLEWAKRGLPVLANRDAAMEAVLARAGLLRHDALADGSAFTCDAIWAGGPDRYVAVCGPGQLDANGAHTDLEHVFVGELANYAERMKTLAQAFAAHLSRQPTWEYA